MKLELESCIKPDVNCVEVYICNNTIPKNIENKSSIIDISWNKSIDITKILKNYLNYKTTTELIEYNYRDLCYSYDRSNDGQKVIRRKFIKDIYTDLSYAISYEEEILPSHIYPCVNELSHKKLIQRNLYRINNRMNIVHDIEIDSKNEYMYIRYNHSPQVDLKKNEIDFQRAYNALTKKQ